MKDNTLGSNGEISRVRQFLTPDYDYGDNVMRNFAQTNKVDTIGDDNIDENVYHFVNPIIGLSRENALYQK